MFQIQRRRSFCQGLSKYGSSRERPTRQNAKLMDTEEQNITLTLFAEETYKSFTKAGPEK